MKFENLLTGTIRKESFCIPKETIIEGLVRSESSGQISGTVHGDVLVKNRVLILKDGIVNGNISADEIIIYGQLTGDVKNCNKLTVHSGAVIRGNIAAIEIHTEKDAIIEGHIVKPGMTATAGYKKETGAKPRPSASSIPTDKSPADPNGALKQETWF